MMAIIVKASGEPQALEYVYLPTFIKRLRADWDEQMHMVVDGLPAHKKVVVKQYVASTNGKLNLHFLPGYALDLNLDELVWSHAKRAGTARRPLRKSENLEAKGTEQFQAVADNQALVRSFFQHSSVVYISDC